MYSNMISQGWLRVHAPKNCDARGGGEAGAGLSTQVDNQRENLAHAPSAVRRRQRRPLLAAHLHDARMVHVRHDGDLVAQLAYGTRAADVHATSEVSIGGPQVTHTDRVN